MFMKLRTSIPTTNPNNVSGVGIGCDDVANKMSYPNLLNFEMLNGDGMIDGANTCTSLSYYASIGRIDPISDKFIGDDTYEILEPHQQPPSTMMMTEARYASVPQYHHPEHRLPKTSLMINDTNHQHHILDEDDDSSYACIEGNNTNSYPPIPAPRTNIITTNNITLIDDNYNNNNQKSKHKSEDYYYDEMNSVMMMDHDLKHDHNQGSKHSSQSETHQNHDDDHINNIIEMNQDSYQQMVKNMNDNRKS